MAINQTLLALAMDELTDTNKSITSQVRRIEHWWDGIGKWKAQNKENSKYLIKLYYEVITHPNTNINHNSLNNCPPRLKPNHQVHIKHQR